MDDAATVADLRQSAGTRPTGLLAVNGTRMPTPDGRPPSTAALLEWARRSRRWPRRGSRDCATPRVLRPIRWQCSAAPAPAFGNQIHVHEPAGLTGRRSSVDSDDGDEKR